MHHQSWLLISRGSRDERRIRERSESDRQGERGWKAQSLLSISRCASRSPASTESSGSSGHSIHPRTFTYDQSRRAAIHTQALRRSDENGKSRCEISSARIAVRGSDRIQELSRVFRYTWRANESNETATKADCSPR